MIPKMLLIEWVRNWNSAQSVTSESLELVISEISSQKAHNFDPCLSQVLKFEWITLKKFVFMTSLSQRTTGQRNKLLECNRYSLNRANYPLKKMIISVSHSSLFSRQTKFSDVYNSVSGAFNRLIVNNSKSATQNNSGRLRSIALTSAAVI